MTLLDPRRTASATGPEPSVPAEPAARFDLHGLAGMVVEAGAPAADQLRTMFGAFVADDAPHPVVTVGCRPADMAGAAYAEHEYRYTDDAVEISAVRARVSRDGAGYRVDGAGELLTTVLPVLDHLLVSEGCAMIHAATFRVGGLGVAMPAAGGAGKTSTVAKLMRHDDVAFMGDDWAFLTSTGRLLGFAKPMFIKPHHRPIYPHLFDGPRKPLVPSALTGPIGRLTTAVHPWVVQRPRLAAAARSWSPEHRMVPPAQALPGKEIATSAPLSVCVFVERSDSPDAELAERDRAWMTSRLVGNFHAELSRPSRDVLTALGGAGFLPLDALFAAKAAVLYEGLGATATWLLRVPRAWSPDAASDAIVSRLLELTGR